MHIASNSTLSPSSLYQADQVIGTAWQQVTWLITANQEQTRLSFDMGRNSNTYFIDDVSKIIDANQIEKTNWKNKQSEIVNNYLPDVNPVRILMTSGASCPDTVVEAVIKKILSFYQLEDAFEKVKESWMD